MQCHENCNAMSSFTVLHHVPWNTFICKAGTVLHHVPWNTFICKAGHVFIRFYGFYLLFTIFFSDAADNEHS